MSKKLTIGMAVYDDYDGLYFTIQSLRIYQLSGIENDVEFIIIDNNPSTVCGEATKKFVNNWVKGKYIPFSDKKSTSIRNEIFNQATGEYTLCMDSHVMLEPGAIKNLLDYYNKNPDTKNLISGPLWYDDLKSVSTHFKPVWNDIMYGVWETNGDLYEKGDPFEIPMMGLGVFSCKTSEWQGFNPNFKGFGGEEGYIHEKFRRAGGKCICLPNFRWNHRFDRPNGVPYPNIIEDRVWNYFVGWLEILKDPRDPFFEGIINTFKDKLPEPVIRNIFQKAKVI